MGNKTFYNEILIDHNLHPSHKRELKNADMVLEGVNPSCGDDIWLQLKLNNNVIEDAAFLGEGCAISQASADIMVEMIKGKTVEEAKYLSELFSKMIKGSATEEEIDMLEEAGALQDISHMPARVKCAILGWRTMNEMLK